MKPGALLLSFFVLLISCAPPTGRVRQVHEGLVAPCPKEVVMRVRYCPTRYAYSDRIQHLSKIKVISLDTGKSLTISVRKNSSVKGLCIPKKYKHFMSRGNTFRAKVKVLRCGENNVKKCPLLPLGTILLVKNLKNGKTVRVKVLDRGPYIRGRHLDLSKAAAKRLGMFSDGVIPFVAEVVRCGG